MFVPDIGFRVPYGDPGDCNVFMEARGAALRGAFRKYTMNMDAFPPCAEEALFFINSPGRPESLQSAFGGFGDDCDFKRRLRRNC